MSETPETDAECAKPGLCTSIKSEIIGAHFARRLEKQRDVLKNVAVAVMNNSPCGHSPDSKYVHSCPICVSLAAAKQSGCFN